MKKPKVSVIIPTYNRAQFVTKAIDSVLSQTFQDYEIIVIDDGSSDTTRQVLEPYRAKIKYIHQENSGVSAARNTGIKKGQGDWVAFLDSDDEWLPEYLSRQMERARQNPEVCMHITNSIQIRADGSRVNTFEDNKYDLYEQFKGSSSLIIRRPLNFIVEHYITNIQATMINRGALLRSGLFDESMTIAEDLDVIARVSLQGALGICLYPLVHIIRREEQIPNLTSRLFSHAVESQQAFGRVYDKLRTQNNLTRFECRNLDRIRSSNRRAIGNLFLQNRETAKARNCYRDAFMVHPSIRSLGKYLLSFLPGEVSRRFIRKSYHTVPRGNRPQISS